MKKRVTCKKAIMNKLLFLLFPIIVLSIISCKKSKVAGIDGELYEMAQETSGFTWYKNSSALLDKSSGSGHPQEFLRTRYNSIAATQLESNGKIMAGAIFPEGSLIVKELFENSTKLDRYAILYKDTDNEAADDNGWVWGYINENGNVSVSASTKGTQCISCHTQADNIDYMLMNKYFP
jgi:hypothetical protein